jgi:hypothetical protein
MQTYPILQSGFIGLSENGLKRPEPIQPSFRDAVIFKEVKFPLDKYKYSPLVKQLFVDWSANKDLLKDFDFREKIISAALTLFGSTSFQQWVDLQNRKPTTTPLHSVFIFETLDYLLRNEPRKTETLIWIRLLEADEHPSEVIINADKYFCTETNSCYDNTEKLPVKLINIIRTWVSKERGFEDLLLTLFVIFGDRSAQTTVTKQNT